MLMISKQVDKSHYDFARYMSRARWQSLWHQLDEVLRLQPTRVLEVGPGPGIFKSLAKLAGLSVETLDIDPELNPDHVGSVTAIPLPDHSYDVVCAFQILEHLPYEQSLLAFREMTRVSRRHLVISLPDAKAVWRYTIQIPKLGVFDCLVPKPFAKVQPHTFDGEHYWEINKEDYYLKKISRDLSEYASMIKTYRVTGNPYHRFFVFKNFNL